jgi:hypothetical protein
MASKRNQGRALAEREILFRLKAWRKENYNYVRTATALGITAPTLRNTVRRAISLKLIKAAEILKADKAAQIALVRDPTVYHDDRKIKQALRTRAEEAEAQLAAYKRAHKYKATARKSRRKDIMRVIIPDSHGSYADKAAIGAFLSDLKRLDADEIVMLGDHIDCGGFLAAHHTLGYVAQSTYTYADDLAAANSFLDAIQEAAPRARIHYLEGNHEWRVERWAVTQQLSNQADAQMLVDALAPKTQLQLKRRGITYYARSERYDNLPVPGTLRLGHTFFAHDPGPGSHPEMYARRFGGSIWYGHQHRARSSIIRNVQAGAVGAWCPGTLAGLQPLYSHTNITDWTHGYGIQTVSESGLFASMLVPIIEGVSMLSSLMGKS